VSEQELVDVERRFWTEGVEFARSRVTQDCLMVFPPPAGVLDREAALTGLEGAPRWEEVELSDVRVTFPAPDVAGVVYAAAARRPGDEQPYRALASSVYVRRDGAWLLAQHQQTPVAG
jgi:hypothetical protein